MQKLLEFLIGKRHWILFFLCEIISFILLFHHSTYQRNVFLSSSDTIAGYISSFSGSAISYMKLHEENKVLFEKNGELELQLLQLQEQLRNIMLDTINFNNTSLDTIKRDYQYINAEVVNNSVIHLNNYITINKGKKHGVKPDMGVISTNGVVGIVSTVKQHFSVVIPLLNPKLKLSCKLNKGNYYGSLHWDGRDFQYANLEQLPRHSEFEEGDTVVTSGYSAVFPQGILVGTVAEYDKTRNYSFYSLKVKLATDFQSLKSVRVVNYSYHEERLELESEARRND